MANEKVVLTTSDNNEPLPDTTGQGGKVLARNVGNTDWEFVDQGGGASDPTYTPANFTPTDVDIDGYLEGIDDTLGNLAGTSTSYYNGYTTSAVNWNSATWTGFHTVPASWTDQDVVGITRTDSTFTVSETGTYIIHVRLGMFGDDYTIGCRVRSGGSTILQSSNFIGEFSSSNQYFPIGVFGAIQLSANDTFDIEYAVNGAGGTGTWGPDTLNGEATRTADITVFKVGSSAGTASGTPMFLPDYPPETASVYDDEFNGNTLSSKWTEWNPGSDTQTLSMEDARFVIRKDGTGALINNSGIFQDAPAGDFMAWAKLSVKHDLSTGSDDFLQVGIFVSDDVENNPTTAPMRCAIYSMGANSSDQGNDVGYVSRTNYNAGSSLNARRASWDQSMYLKMRVVSGNMSVDYSVDGTTWTNINNSLAIGFTPGQIGLFISNRTTNEAELAVDFFRVVEGTPSFMDTAYGRVVNVGASGSGGTETMTITSTTQTTQQQAGYEVLSAFEFDPADFDTPSLVEFRALIDTTDAADAAEIRIFNVTTASEVAGSLLSTTNTNTTLVTADLTSAMASGSNIYEVQLKLQTTGAPNTASCKRAELRIS